MESRRHAITDNERTLSSVFIAMAMFVGLVSTDVSAFLFQYLFHFLFLVIVLSFCTLNANILHVSSSVSRTTWMAMAWQMAGIPSIVTLACFLTNADFLTTAVVIATTTAGSVFASLRSLTLLGWTARWQFERCFCQHFLMPVSLLFFGEINGIISRDLSLFNYVQHVVFFLLLPMVVAMTYWEYSPRLGREGSLRMLRGMHWAATLTMMGFCGGMMSKLHGAGSDHYEQLVHYILLVSATVVAIYVITGLLFAHLGHRSALTLECWQRIETSP